MTEKKRRNVGIKVLPTEKQVALWRVKVKAGSLAWLLEPDAENPAVRYLALRDLTGLSCTHPELVKAKENGFATGPIARVLEAQRPAGYWVKPGAGYSPKYTGTVWSLALLAQLGADVSEPRVLRAAEYVLEKTVAPVGWFSYNGTNSGVIHCHAGYLGESMHMLGLGDDPRVNKAIELQARLITGEGIAEGGSDNPLRYYRYTFGSNFICGANGGKPCAWGAAKAMKAMTAVPEHKRTPIMVEAINKGTAFFLGTDLTKCNFPYREGGKVSANWLKFGFPNFYISDMLEVLEILSRFGRGGDPRLENAWQLVMDKQDAAGRWPMEYSYNGKIWSNIEAKGKPSKWVTLRVLRTLKAAFPG
ncbi:Prenyltransferase-like protein [Dehalogenimonas alkenigignens]|uniref:Prenyltransferase-like protein n=1 Tax=Dehalogenimonas alkenigignens TaxID=1217799 RepID=A0A0W0GIN6_9CHLR|nr:nitrogen fixation protein NifH [Dehalogenimonas alkenigignens]KTB48423.1 Prenyltransferase-like protein [Dehalogenimonas alkenigignens]